ncbi:hypothetical protein ACFC1I_05440 [Microbacterium sp. NPDC056044]|uniref:hypothetical protein n=1 Tax=Microbacterium sp. NPDC056044 TaxID=3345690 RepID=UPI0035D88873
MTDAPAAARPTVAPIGDDDAEAVAEFFHRHLNSQVGADRWLAVVRPPWSAGPNRGFRLIVDDVVVGAYAAVYSSRETPEGALQVCNLAAFCVLPEYRAHSLRLVRALLGQKGYLFTDLSPSGNVPAMNERLGFARLDTATRLAVNVPGRAGRHVEVIEDLDEIADALGGFDAKVFTDHRDAPAARHLLVRSAGGHAYLMYRRDRRKQLPVFATPLFVGGDPGVLAEAWHAVASRLLRRGFAMTLAERRVLGFSPRGAGRELRSPRPRMYKGAGGPGDVDYIYSELTLLEW